MSASMQDGIELPRSDFTGAPVVNPDIFRLEEKPKPVLAHELGAGAPCLNCKEDCPGLDLHFWRKICKACKCRKDDHDIRCEGIDPGTIRIGRLFDHELRSMKEEESFTTTNNKCDASTQDNQGFDDKREDNQTQTDIDNAQNQLKQQNELKQTYAWIPEGITADLVHRYMEALNAQNVPLRGTEGEVNRCRIMEQQLPLHDCDAKACKSLVTEKEKDQMEKYVDHIKKEVVGIGQVAEVNEKEREQGNKKMIGVSRCESCRNKMDTGSVGVYTDHSDDIAWHPNCFRCSTCDQLLVDMLYFYKDGKYYCGRHFGDTMYPRCAGCDELIFAKEYTRAEERDWHLNHFCCFGCDLELGGHRYMMRDTNPYCITCYMNLFARTCQYCTEKIQPDTQRISHKELHWHADNQCFKCYKCSKPLVGSKFVIKETNVFCSGDCKRAFYDQI